MHLRRLLPFVVLALTACPSVDRVGAPPDKLAFATFDSVNAVIPLPNDLALQRAPGLPTGVQKELLGSFVAAGGFPTDQEVAITIPITIRSRQPDGTYAAPVAPDGLDLPTVDDAHVALFRVDVSPAQRLLRCATPVTAVCWEPSYAVPANSTSGQLSLRRNDPSGNRRWDAGGRYVVALRAGVMTSDGLSVNADGPVALIAPNHALTVVENQPPGGLPAATAATVEGLRSLYATSRTWAPVPDAAICAGAGVPVAPCWLPLPSTNATAAFDVVQQVFPIAELAAIQTFTAQPGVRPFTDAGSGTMPLPSDFLLDPASGKVRKVAAFGPAADGLATLDGFSTTAPLLIPLTGPVQAATITRSSARIYKITSGGPVQLDDLASKPTAPQIVTQPPTAVVNGAATSIVLAPAVPVPVGANVIAVPPLDEKSQYLVVVTNDVKDVAGQRLKRSTMMDLVFTLNSALYDPSKPAGSRSLVPGVADADAAGLQQLRTSLKPVLQALSLDSCANNATCAVLAYTVKTQSVKDVSVQLAAAPFSIEQGAGGAVFVPSQTAAFDTQAQFGIPAAAFPNVAKFVETTVPTLYAIQGSTGAFDPAFATWTPAQVHANIKLLKALVAIPSGAAVASAPACPAPNDALKCVPLVVFHHGLNGARYQMLAVADSLAAQGFVVAAIDAPYHGDRAYCAQNSDCTTGSSDGVCTPNPAFATPVDTTPPGTCTTGTLKRNASLSTVASGNYFITGNFFRIRDGIRQDQLDHAALVQALARPPAAPVAQPPSTPDLAIQLATTSGVAIDPREVRFSGISLGGMVGTSIVATNPRFKRAALTVPGGTLVDVFTSSPTFQPRLAPIFSGLGIDLTRVSPTVNGQPNPSFDPAQASKYAQTLALAKWILDPAEPVNYAANVQTKVTPADPNIAGLFGALTAGGVASTTTEAWGQMVTNDQVVTNPYNSLLLQRTGAPFAVYTSASLPPSVLHGLLLTNFTTGGPQAAGDALRADLASFLATGAAPTPSAIP